MLTKSLLLAIMLTESAFRPDAVSPKNAVGLMQITPIAVREVQAQEGLNGHVDLFDPETNIRYAKYLLKFYAKESINEKEMLALYSGGYRQLNRLRSGQPIAKETYDYLHRVLSRADLFAELFDLCPSFRVPYQDIVERVLYSDDPVFKRTRREAFERIPRAAQVHVPEGRPAGDDAACESKYRNILRAGH